MATHQLPSRSMAGSTRQMTTELSSPLRETEWHFSVSAASWAPAPEMPPLWRGPDPFGWGWRCGRRAGSRRRCQASRWWWTSSLQLWKRTSSLRTNAWFQPSVNKSSSSSGPLVWAFGTFALFVINRQISFIRVMLKKKKKVWSETSQDSGPLTLLSRRFQSLIQTETSTPAHAARIPPALFSCSLRQSHEWRCFVHIYFGKHTVLLHSASREGWSYQQEQQLPLQKTISAVSGESRQPIGARRLIWRDASAPPLRPVQTDAQRLRGSGTEVKVETEQYFKTLTSKERYFQGIHQKLRCVSQSDDNQQGSFLPI